MLSPPIIVPKARTQGQLLQLIDNCSTVAIDTQVR